MRLLKPTRLATILALVLIGIYIAVLSYLSINRFQSMNAHYYDLGIMDQVVFNTSKGRLLRMTDPDIATNTSRLSVHFDPILVIFSPLYKIVASPINLLVAQSVILGLGGFAVYLIGRRVLKNSWHSLLFVFLYLNYYPLQAANLFDFHAVTVATTALLFAYYFLALKPIKESVINYLLGTICIVVTILSKENASLVVGCLFGYLYYTNRKKKIYLVLSVVSVVSFFLVVFQLIPMFRSSSSFALSYFDLHEPLTLVRRFFSYDSYLYVRKLFTPLSFLPLLSPLHLFIVLPELLINILSSNSNLRDLHFHYTSMITPFLIIASIYGFEKVRGYVFNAKKLMRGVFVILIVTSVLSTLYDGTIAQAASLKVNRETLAEVMFWRNQLGNQQIRISTTGTIAPFFTEHRRYYYFLFDPAFVNQGKSVELIRKQIDNYKKAEYVIIREEDVALNDPLIREHYDRLKNDTDYIKISDRRTIEVYRKVK